MNIKLMNVNHEFYAIPFDKEIELHEAEDIVLDDAEDVEPNDAESMTRYSMVYHDPINNNKIVFAEFRFSNEPLNENISDVIDYCMGLAYDYLCRILNNFRNVCVYMEQLYMRTASYIIMYDCADKVNSIKDVDDILSNVDVPPFKYWELKA